MANETIKIGCRLPSGYVLEVGLQTTVRGGPKDGLIALVKKQKDYQRKVLHGTHAHNARLLIKGIRLPAELSPEPYINTVPLALWLRWKKEHEDSGVLKSGQLFEIADVKDTKAILLDVMAQPAPLAPLDPAKIFKHEDNKVETADFDE